MASPSQPLRYSPAQRPIPRSPYAAATQYRGAAAGGQVNPAPQRMGAQQAPIQGAAPMQGAPAPAPGQSAPAPGQSAPSAYSNGVVTPQPLPGSSAGPPGTQPGGLSYQPLTDTNQTNQLYLQNRGLEAGLGEQILGQTGGQMNYYSGQQAGYQQAANTGYNQLAQNPGYTQAEAGQIDPNFNALVTPNSQFQNLQLTPQEQQNIVQNPYLGLQSSTQGTQALGQQLNAYQSNLGGAAQQAQSWLAGDPNYQSSLGSTLGAESGAVNKAAYNPSLGFDPNGTEKQLTDQNVSDISNLAATTAGDVYRGQEDQLKQGAIMQGNASPLAVAADQTAMGYQSAAAQGEAAAQARLGALGQQFGQASNIEQQRQAAAQNQAQTQIGAAATLANTGLSTEQNLEQTLLQRGQLAGGIGMQAAEASGNAGLQAGEFSTAQNAGQAALADQMASQAGSEIAQNRQQTGEYGINTGYQQGMGAAEAGSGAAQSLGNARIAGQQNYLNYLTGEQQMAQQGTQNSLGAELGAYGSMSGNLNNITAARGNYSIGAGAQNFGTQLGSSFANALFDEGGVVDSPTVGVAGESGPELAIPLRYLSDTQGLGALNGAPPAPAPQGAQPQLAPKASGFKNFLNYVGSGQGIVPSAMQAADPNLAPAGGAAPGGQPAPGGGLLGMGIRAAGLFAGEGKLIDKPTLMIAGEKEPEAIIPLNNRPSNKIGPAALGTLGAFGNSLRTRMHRPSGPSAARAYAPVRSEVPIHPAQVFR